MNGNDPTLRGWEAEESNGARNEYPGPDSEGFDPEDEFEQRFFSGTYRKVPSDPWALDSPEAIEAAGYFSPTRGQDREGSAEARPRETPDGN